MRLKGIILILFAFFLSIPLISLSKHITGGEVIYENIVSGNTVNAKQYRITLKLFRDNTCTGCADLPATVGLAIYNNDNGQRVGGFFSVDSAFSKQVPILAAPKCLENPPYLDYSVGYYIFSRLLPLNQSGYTVTFQTCCRVDGIENTNNSVGATYVGQIPGLNTLDNTSTNDNSPKFEEGISIICAEKRFRLNFSATDIDGDQLVYSLCSAYNGGAARDASFATPAAPPYSSIPYINGFSASFPLGLNATINPNTGIISGIAPEAGKYVVAVCVEAFRNGQLISNHRKDFIITVAPCDFSVASLIEYYPVCNLNQSTQFTNLSNSPLNETYYWDFGDPASGSNNTSTQESPSHQFTSPGVYEIFLVVNQGTECESSDTAQVGVWPGFIPDFTVPAAVCTNVPITFEDKTRANFGIVNTWKWSFDINNESSSLQNPVFSYPQAGTFSVKLISSSDKGCIDSITKPVTILSNPSLNIGNDTLICKVDTLELNAITTSTNGSITWSPNYMIDDIHSFTPKVSPNDTTTYTAIYTDAAGCSTSANIKVNVVEKVTLTMPKDTLICRTDTIRLKPITNAIYYQWTPNISMSNSTWLQPIVWPNASLQPYILRAYISDKCEAYGKVEIKIVPYPNAKITGDTAVCFGRNAYLQASGGSFYAWYPTTYLNNPNISNPIAINPQKNVMYTVSVTDTLGCPKPSFASIGVAVVKISADAGPQDTIVVLNQPLQLHGTGGGFYNWQPNSYINYDTIQSPVSLPLNDITYKLTVSNSIGCMASDTIRVKVYKLAAGFYVPSAFTPSGDGLNDIIRPIAPGVKQLYYFRIFNRFGEKVYETASLGQGWNGLYKGVLQSTANFVWEASGIDYQNKPVYGKGNVILIK